jgi:hypothetical protein
MAAGGAVEVCCAAVLIANDTDKNKALSDIPEIRQIIVWLISTAFVRAKAYCSSHSMSIRFSFSWHCRIRYSCDKAGLL